MVVAPLLRRAALVFNSKTAPQTAASSPGIELMFNPTENAAIDIEHSIEFFARVPHGGLVAPPPPKPRGGAAWGRGASRRARCALTTCIALSKAEVERKLATALIIFLACSAVRVPPRRPAPFRSCSCSSPIRLDRVLSIAWRARGQCHRIYPLRDHLPHLRHHAISAPDTLVMSYSRLRAPFSAAQDRCRAGDSDVPKSAQYTFIQGPDGIRRRANKSEVSDAPEGARIFRSDLN